MKIQVLYQPNSDHARRVEEFVHDYKRAQSGEKPELFSMDTKEGDQLGQLYGVVQYPAVIVTSDDGSMLKLWEGDQLPLMNEVAAYAAA